MKHREPAIERRARGQLFEVADDVVRRIADEPPRERNTGDVRHRARRAGQRFAKHAEQLGAVLRDGAAVGTETEAIPVEFHLETIAETDEGVAGEALSTFDALQEETGLERRELHERRNRRVEITRDVKVRLHAVNLQSK